MPNIQSAKKRMRQNVKRRLQNKSCKSATKTQKKNFLQLIGEGKVEEAKAALPKTISTLDRAAKKGVYHKNYIARQKSMVYNKLNQLLKQESASG